MSTGINAVDFYLRILLAIDSEAVDRDIPHTAEVVTVILSYAAFKL